MTKADAIKIEVGLEQEENMYVIKPTILFVPILSVVLIAAINRI